VKFTGILRSAILQGEKLSRGGHKITFVPQAFRKG